ncbi:MAG TPA: glycosyltransferase family 1 protein [Verrucomicrobiae bacterium]|nr:glycosyltransferase family 1 protein [Verrucomicrobiae bacterium]
MTDARINTGMNRISPNCIRVAVDAHRLVCESHTSGAFYLGSMLQEWIAPDPVFHFDLLLPVLPERQTPWTEIFSAPNVRLVTPERKMDPTVSYRAQLFWQQVVIPSLMHRLRSDLYFSPFHLTPLWPRRVPVVSTIHDLCFLSDPFFSLGHQVHRWQINSACLRAKALICVSQFTCAALARWSPRAAQKAVVVPNGIDSDRLAVTEAKNLIEHEAIPVKLREYFIWVGNPGQERKNIPLLLQAFVAHRKVFPEHRLVMVVPQSARGALMERELARQVGSSLVLLSGISGQLRDALYACAAALVFPSTCEGFGYPVAEAMAQGCPPIAAATGPAAEIVGGAVPLCADFQPQSFVQRMRECVGLREAQRASDAEKLRRRAEEFSIKRMAAATLKVLSGALGQ